MASLKEMIDAMVERRLAETIAEMMGSPETGIATTLSNYRERGENTRSIAAKRIMDREIASTDEPIVRRRRRGRNPRVGYIVVTNRLGRFTNPESLHQTALVVFKAIAKSKVPLSNPDLERVTGLKRKTVESSVWYLRRHDADNNRVKDGKGLITATPLDADKD